MLGRSCKSLFKSLLMTDFVSAALGSVQRLWLQHPAITCCRWVLSHVLWLHNCRELPDIHAACLQSYLHEVDEGEGQNDWRGGCKGESDDEDQHQVANLTPIPNAVGPDGCDFVPV